LEEQLAIARLKKGDLAGMEPLVRCYQVQAVYAAFLVVQDMALAEDVVQAAFLRAAERIDQFDTRRSFGGWFFRSVMNDAIKAAKRQQRNVPLVDEVDDDHAGLAGGVQLTDTLPGPEELVESEETRRAVWQALEQLAPEQRAVVIAHHFLGMSTAEMTAEFERPSSTIYWWLRTARKRLEELLERFRQQSQEERQD
jgi:RNA polymerase sigma-70 factor (ECF subfamily)